MGNWEWEWGILSFEFGVWRRDMSRLYKWG
jgi:hypothetical protein